MLNKARTDFGRLVFFLVGYSGSQCGCIGKSVYACMRDFTNYCALPYTNNIIVIIFYLRYVCYLERENYKTRAVNVVCKKVCMLHFKKIFKYL